MQTFDIEVRLKSDYGDEREIDDRSEERGGELIRK